MSQPTVLVTVLGIENSKRVIAELGEIAVTVIGIAKRGIGLGSLRQLLAVLEDVKELASAAPKALPELTDVDAKEAGELATASYVLVKSIVAAVTAAK